MDLPVVVDFTSASLCFSITAVTFTESEENDCRHRGEKALPVMPPSRKAYSPPTRYQWWPQCLIFIALQTCCEVSLRSFKFIRDNGAICNAHISAKTSVILRISQKTRQHNGFINYAVMQIREDELQILCDKVWSTAGFFDNLSSEGSCCCCHGGLSPSFVACPAINDAVIFPSCVCVLLCILSVTVCTCLHVWEKAHFPLPCTTRICTEFVLRNEMRVWEWWWICKHASSPIIPLSSPVNPYKCRR